MRLSCVTLQSEPWPHFALRAEGPGTVWRPAAGKEHLETPVREGEQARTVCGHLVGGAWLSRPLTESEYWPEFEETIRCRACVHIAMSTILGGSSMEAETTADGGWRSWNASEDWE